MPLEDNFNRIKVDLDDCSASVDNKLTVKIVQNDITTERVDCITNTTNPALKHKGGLAAAVSRAGG